MTGPEAIAYIHGFSWLGSKPGLARTQELLDRLGHPEQALKFVHLAGTNGKGSTAAMIASILCAAGYRTGLYTSPYLVRFHERIRLNSDCISDADLGAVVETVRSHADQMEQHPTEFELVTCAALEYYRQKHCQIVVLEAGMGGRLDATNTISAPEVAVLTRIGLDHTEYLGGTVEQIAHEKAAIIKPGASVVSYPQPPEIARVIRERCAQTGASVRFAAPDAIRVESDTLEGQVFCYRALEHLHLPLLGTHQQSNAAVALEAVFALRERGWTILDGAIRDGLARTRWPARFELLPLPNRPRLRFILDGGHNPQCAQAVADNLAHYFPGEKPVFLTGVLADKDYPAMMACLAPLAQSFVTVAPNSPRALAAETLADLLRQRYSIPAQACPDVPDGLRAAVERAGDHGLVCCVGSLYLAGEVLDKFAPKERRHTL